MTHQETLILWEVGGGRNALGKGNSATHSVKKELVGGFNPFEKY